MNKNEVVKIVAEEIGLTQKDVASVIDNFFGTITNELKNGSEIAIAGFGKFVVKNRAARDSINPRTKEIVHVKASKAVAFRPSKSLKETVNN